ncbi:MAG: hypothetical protein VW124_13695 [Paracoccaceae bacterium]
MAKIVIDLDNTITIHRSHDDYAKKKPNLAVVSRLRDYKKNGWYICIYTARQMRTHNGNMKKLNTLTLPVIERWLNMHSVPYDEIVLGKPWPEQDGFYVDDKAIRPSEFVQLDASEIKEVLDHEGKYFN